MNIVIRYEALDGTIYTSEEACYEHDKNLYEELLEKIEYYEKILDSKSHYAVK